MAKCSSMKGGSGHAQGAAPFELGAVGTTDQQWSNVFIKGGLMGNAIQPLGGSNMVQAMVPDSQCGGKKKRSMRMRKHKKSCKKSCKKGHKMRKTHKGRKAHKGKKGHKSRKSRKGRK